MAPWRTVSRCPGIGLVVRGWPAGLTAGYCGFGCVPLSQSIPHDLPAPHPSEVAAVGVPSATYSAAVPLQCDRHILKPHVSVTVTGWLLIGSCLLVHQKGDPGSRWEICSKSHRNMDLLSSAGDGFCLPPAPGC